MQQLSKNTVNHTNNFDLLRLLFALFVMITHSYPLTGVAEIDILAQITHGQALLSKVGVNGFFVISGYLIFQSLTRSKSGLDYLKKRFLRIYPGLTVVLVLSVLLGAAVSEYGLLQYFTSWSTLTYIPNNLLMKIQYGITGSFQYNAFTFTMNGCLWTIPYEVLFYIVLFSLFSIRNNKKAVIILLFATYLFFFVYRFSGLLNFNFEIYRLGFSTIAELGLFFIGGSLMAALHIEKLHFRNWISILFFGFVILAFIFNYYYIAQVIILPILLTSFGSLSTPFIRGINQKIGDLSYGIYIYGFPIQQTCYYYFKPNYLQMMAISIPITLIFAWLSWNLVEKRALALKNK
jgi:peptidoglycan/LPS O-acetylase OafA/YrhL